MFFEFTINYYLLQHDFNSFAQHEYNDATPNLIRLFFFQTFYQILIYQTAIQVKTQLKRTKKSNVNDNVTKGN